MELEKKKFNLTQEYQIRFLKNFRNQISAELTKITAEIYLTFEEFHTSKREIEDNLHFLLENFKTLVYDKKQTLKSDSKLAMVYKLAESVIEDIVENQTIAFAKEILQILELTESTNMSVDLQSLKSASIKFMNQGLQKRGFPIVDAEQHQRIIEKKTHIFTEKFLPLVNPNVSINTTFLNSIEQEFKQYEIQLDQLFRQITETINMELIENFNQDRAKEKINQIVKFAETLLGQVYARFQQLTPVLYNVNLFNQRMKEIHLMQHYKKFDRIMLELMFIIYTNKKKFFERLIYLHTCNLKSAQRDQQITQLIECFLTELKKEINDMIQMCRSHEYVYDWRFSYQQKTFHASTNIDSVTVQYVSPTINYDLKHVECQSEIIVKEVQEQAQKLEQEIIQDQQKYIKDIEEIKRRLELHERQYANIIKERQLIINIETGLELQKIYEKYITLPQILSEQCKTRLLFLTGISKQLLPQEMYILNIMKLIETVCQEFSFSEKIVKKILTSKIQEILVTKNNKFVTQAKRIEDYLFLNYLEFYEDLILPQITTPELKKELCFYLADYILKEKLSIFTVVFFGQNNAVNLTVSSKGFQKKLTKVIKKCFFTDQLVHEKRAFGEVKKEFNDNFKQGPHNAFNEYIVNLLKNKMFDQLQLTQTINLPISIENGSSIYQSLVQEFLTISV